MSIPLSLMDPLTATIVVVSLMLLILLAFGSPIIYTGWKQRQQYHQLSAIHTSLDDAIPGEAVAVSGTVSSQSRTIDSPYRSQRCALALWDTARLSRYEGPQWFLKASGVMADELLITLDTEHAPVTGLPQQRRVSTTAQTLGSALGVDVNSTLELAWSSRIGCSSPTALASLTASTNRSLSSTSSGTSSGSVWNRRCSSPSSASCGHSQTSCSSASGAS